MIKYPKLNIEDNNEILNVVRSRIIIPNPKDCLCVYVATGGELAGLGHHLNQLYDYVVTKDSRGEKILLRLKKEMGSD